MVLINGRACSCELGVREGAGTDRTVEQSYESRVFGCLLARNGPALRVRCEESTEIR